MEISPSIRSISFDFFRFRICISNTHDSSFDRLSNVSKCDVGSPDDTFISSMCKPTYAICIRVCSFVNLRDTSMTKHLQSFMFN